MFSLHSHDTSEAQKVDWRRVKPKISHPNLKRDHLGNIVEDSKRRYTMKKRNARRDFGSRQTVRLLDATQQSKFIFMPAA